MSIDTRVQPHDHAVLFYEDDDDLISSVCQYVIDGLEADEVAVVVATVGHSSAFELAMRRAGVDVGRARAEGRLVTLNADKAMSRFLVDDWPKSSAFFAQFGELIRGAAGTGRQVRVYGEMVAVLWDAGHVAAAIELESLWNDLRELVPFSLLCAYPARMVCGDENEASLHQICQCHSEVLGDVPRRRTRAGEIAAESWEEVRWFSCDSRSLSSCRTFIGQTLASWHLDHLTEDATIVGSELATNAVLHARTNFSLSVAWRGDTVRVSVADSSQDMPVMGNPTPTTVTGRGLLLVDALARRWGVEVDTGGKTIWADLVV
ncbi:MAG: hypothetical protein QOE09_246 [Ilumatobacteraceae bacterium]